MRRYAIVIKEKESSVYRVVQWSPLDAEAQMKKYLGITWESLSDAHPDPTEWTAFTRAPSPSIRLADACNLTAEQVLKKLGFALKSRIQGNVVILGAPPPEKFGGVDQTLYARYLALRGLKPEVQPASPESSINYGLDEDQIQYVRYLASKMGLSERIRLKRM